MSATFEATAPCRVDLAAAPEAVSVAIDRRAWCRVETGFDGVAVESKDTLQRIQAARLADLDANASVPVALVREALRAFGVDAGVRVVTQVKVPAASGLGGETALAVALVGALAQALGRDASKRDVEQVAAQVATSALGRAASVADVAASVRGGCVACDAGRGPAAVAVDPAAVEECLMLAEAGATNGAPAVVLDPEGHGSRVRAALVRRPLRRPRIGTGRRLGRPLPCARLGDSGAGAGRVAPAARRCGTAGLRRRERHGRGRRRAAGRARAGTPRGRRGRREGGIPAPLSGPGRRPRARRGEDRLKSL